MCLWEGIIYDYLVYTFALVKGMYTKGACSGWSSRRVPLECFPLKYELLLYVVDFVTSQALLRRIGVRRDTGLGGLVVNIVFDVAQHLQFQN